MDAHVYVGGAAGEEGALDPPLARPEGPVQTWPDEEGR